MDGEKLNPRSLQNELTFWIFIITLTICTMGGVSAGLLAYFEAREMQDEVLFQIAQIISGEENNDSQKPKYHHKDSTIIVQSSLDNHGPLDISSIDSDGFATIDSKGDSWRIYHISKQDNRQFIVAQQTELRNEIAWASAMSAILPICLLAIILLILIRWLIYSRMKPITRLSKMVDRQSTNDLNPLSIQSIPLEILPFVDAINRLLVRTKQSMAEQRRFIADASHELRTPITALSLLAENLDQSKSLSEQTKRLGLVRHGLDRLNNLVNQLLNLARLQSTQANSVEHVQFDEIIKDVVVLLYPLVEQKNIDLGITKATPVLTKDINGSLQQLVENALANAIHYTPDNGKIDVSVQVSDDRAIFSVSDTGPGIDQQEIDKVINPFYRAENNSSPGSGLGLAICAEIAKLHDGKISLRNRDSGGLIFTFVQPVSTKQKILGTRNQGGR